LAPGDAQAHTNLGAALRQQGRPEDAEASCARALAINPDLVAAIVLQAQIHADKGEFTAAESALHRAVGVDPDAVEAWAAMANLRKMTADDSRWLTAAQGIAGKSLPPHREMYLRYALGKYFDDVGDYEQAFTNYQRANGLSRHDGSAYDRSAIRRCADLMIESFDRQWFSRTRFESEASDRPVLIVGMPRSGTTLAEQILASHPQVFGAGELPYWSSAWETHATTILDAGMRAGLMAGLARDYLRQLGELSADAGRIIDKMPGNFMYLGLIHAAMPKARIIHMQRNPLDTCLSIYFQNFQSAHRYANDLDHLAHYYGEYLRVMNHWRQTLPREALLDVRYEDLVADQEASSRKMLNFIGLPWDSRCLDFHRTSRIVPTLSKWQVRQKISATSVGRWRNYRQFIGPLLQLAEPDPRSP